MVADIYYCIPGGWTAGTRESQRDLKHLKIFQHWERSLITLYLFTQGEETEQQIKQNQKITERLTLSIKFGGVWIKLLLK